MGAPHPKYAHFHSRQVKSQDHKRWQLRRLWGKDKRCHWCKLPTVLLDRSGDKKIKRRPDEATIDHLDPRHSPERGKHEGEFRRVLACLKCNGERDKQQLAAMPIQELWERGFSIYGIAKTSGALNEVDGWKPNRK